MMIVAFYSQNYDNLFMMLFTKMAAKQISINVLEYAIPILRVKPKLKLLNIEYADTLEEFRQHSEEEIRENGN